MRKVFSSNSQLCHVWANQGQSEGRANNMFFEGDTIYSYGYHFKAAKIHTVKGKKITLVNSCRYSSSTGKHLNDITIALRGLMDYYTASDVTDLKKASKELDAKAAERLQGALRVMKVWSAKDQLGYILDAFAEASNLRSLLGKKELKPDAKLLKEVKTHFAKRAKRTEELEAPKRVEREKRDAERQAKYELEKVELIARFRNGETVFIHSLENELLQVKDDTVRTSGGAEVPLKEATMLYRAIESGKPVIGAKVGHFTVESITPIKDDKIVKIGCHKILLSEAKQVLSLRAA